MSAQAAATPALSRSAAGDRSPWLIAIVVSIATFMVVLDTAIANVSLRYIAGSLAVSVDESTWIVTTYLIANAVILPGWALSAVVVAPDGARPSYAHGYYARDNAFYIAWDGIARERETFLAWMRENVLR